MEGCARLTGNVQRGQRGVASEIHEIAPQDYAAHKRVNGKGEDGERERESNKMDNKFRLRAPYSHDRSGALHNTSSFVISYYS